MAVEKSTVSIDFFQNVDDEDTSIVEDKVDDSKVTYGNVPSWIFSRGFTKETLNKWNCGYASNGNLAIPIYNTILQIVGLIHRQPVGREPRYLYSKGTHTSQVVFGLHNIIGKKLDFVCITEGALDTMWLDQYDFNSVALLGSHLSQHQKKLLVKINCAELVLCFDNDDAGRQISYDVEKEMKDKFVISTIQLPDRYKDVQDIRDKETLCSIIHDRRIFQEA